MFIFLRCAWVLGNTYDTYMYGTRIDWVTYDGAESAAENETEETPEHEPECHGLFAADAIH